MGQVRRAANEADIWSDMNGDNNGGNEPCMETEGCEVYNRDDD